MEGITQNHDAKVTRPQPRVCAGNEVSAPPSAEKSTPYTNETARWQQNRSEVAAFLEQWDQEMESMQQGLHGTAITARHDFILRRMGGLINDDKVMAMWQTLKAEQNASSADRTQVTG